MPTPKPIDDSRSGSVVGLLEAGQRRRAPCRRTAGGRTVTSASRRAAGGVVPGLAPGLGLHEPPGQVDGVRGDAQPHRATTAGGPPAASSGSRCRRRVRRAPGSASPVARSTNPVLQVPRKPSAFHSPTCSSSRPGGRHSTITWSLSGLSARPSGRDQHGVGVVGVGDHRGLLLHPEAAVGRPRWRRCWSARRRRSPPRWWPRPAGTAARRAPCR